MAWWMLAAALVSAPQDGMAMAPAAACPAIPAPLPREYAGWSSMAPVLAGADAGAAGALTIGQGAHATLLPTAQTRFAATMKHAGTPAQFGGNLSFVVSTPGRYRIALATPAWIDVVPARTAATTASVAHGHGPDCSGIRKIVDFDLARGAYVLQVAGNDAATLRVMVLPVAATAP